MKGSFFFIFQTSSSHILLLFDDFQGVRRGGQEIFSFNVLIHGLELLGQEDINVSPTLSSL